VISYGGTSAAVMVAVQVHKRGMSALVVSPDKRLSGLLSGGLDFTDIDNKEVIDGYLRIILAISTRGSVGHCLRSPRMVLLVFFT